MIQSKLVPILIACNLVSLGATLVLVLCGFSTRAKAAFREIDAERVNIVGADGKPRIALANKENIPGPSMNGKTYPREVSDGRQFMAGMIFFNDAGDEVGGLIFNGIKKPDGTYSAVGHLSLDQWKQNQVVALQYIDNSRSRRAGLTVMDRPTDTSLDTDLDLIQKHMTSKSEEERKDIEKTLSDRQKGGRQGVQRMFIGSQDRAAQVQIRDTKGRIRARLVVDEKDNARLEFLDEGGKVTNTYPPAP